MLVFSCSERIIQIKVREQVSPTIFDILIKCVYNHTIIIDNSDDIYDTVILYAADLGILPCGHYLQSDIDYLKIFYSSSVFSDLTLVVGNEKFATHKAVLCARSNVFSAMFSGHYREGSQPEVSSHVTYIYLINKYICHTISCVYT